MPEALKFTALGMLIGSLLDYIFFDFSPPNKQELVCPLSLPGTGTGLILDPDRAPCKMTTPYGVETLKEAPLSMSSGLELGILEPQPNVWPSEGMLQVVPGNGPIPENREGIETTGVPMLMPWPLPAMRYYLPKGNMEYFLRKKVPPPPFCEARKQATRMSGVVPTKSK